jgi:hypothetical protein
LLLLALARPIGSTAQARQPDPQATLYMIGIEDLIPQARPWLIGDDYALVLRNDMPAGVIHTAVLPDQPGDYYIMHIKSTDDLEPIRDRIPYFIIGNEAVFRTDPEGASVLPNYGWGLTKLSPMVEYRYFAQVPAPPVVAEYDPDIADMISEITPQACESRLADITAFPTRYSYSAYCRDAEEYVHNLFNSFGLSSSYFDFSWGGTDMRNVIGEMIGTSQPDSVIIVCGHLDCVSEDPENDAPGAEDNGSGTVSVLEAARILSQYQTDLTVRFIAFTGEEQGLIGSDYYAQHMLDIGEDIGAVINLDMVAYHGPYPIDMHCYSDPQSHWLGHLMAETMAIYTSVDTITHYEDSPGYGSDHYPFAIRGYPAIEIIDAEPWYGEDWYPYYHSTDDIMDHLDMDLQADVARTGTALTAILARVDFGAQEIPTLSEWGLLILTLLLLAFGTIAVIRRRRPVPKTTD